MCVLRVIDKHTHTLHIQAPGRAGGPLLPYTKRAPDRGLEAVSLDTPFAPIADY
jgi:hypothetical protein